MTFFTELKRRNVFRVGIAYLVGAWLILQLLSILLPAFEAPPWIIRVAVIFLALGFFIAVFIAWAFEMTPEGIKPTVEVNPEESIRDQTGRKLNRFVIITLVLALLSVVIDSYVLTDDSSEVLSATEVTDQESTSVSSELSAANTTLARSIAVLPFVDLSQNGDEEYFSDGLTEELLNKLAQVRGLQVAARTSSFFFKGKNEDMRSIAEQLGVNYILEGSVRKSGEQLRITAQLIQADNGFHLWSETYDRKLDNIFAVQDEIAAAVTRALSVTLSSDEFDRPGMTSSIEAYEEFLQANALYALANKEASQQAIDHIERALSIDPDFARAWVAKANIYSQSRSYQLLEQGQNLASVIVEAQNRARALAPEMPELMLMTISELQQGQRNHHDAEALAQSLIENHQMLPEAYALYGSMQYALGFSQEAVRNLEQARRLDPVNANTSWILGQTYLSLGRVNDALVEIERGLAMGNGRQDYLMGLRMIAHFQDRDRSATLAALEQMGNEDLSMTLARLWNDQKNEEALALVQEEWEKQNTGLQSVILSQWALVLGDPQLAMEIKREIRDVSSLWMPYMEEARKLPEFKMFLTETGFVNYYRTSGKWPDKCRPVNDDFECF